MTVVVVPHDPTWKEAFLKEASAIKSALQGVLLDVHHIGSTAIPGILAKPIIDLLGDTDDLLRFDESIHTLEHLGYETMGEYGIEGRRYFRKTSKQGLRTHHLHVFENGSPHVKRHLALRDYLRTHSEVAAEYSALKARLTDGSTPSWDKYANGKGSFVIAVEQDAIEWYRQPRRS